MIGDELVLLEEQRLPPVLHMIESRCLHCGDGKFIGHIDTGFTAWGLHTCDQCRRRLRTDRTLRRLEAANRLGRMDDRMRELWNELSARAEEHQP